MSYPHTINGMIWYRDHKQPVPVGELVFLKKEESLSDYNDAQVLAAVARAEKVVRHAQAVAPHGEISIAHTVGRDYQGGWMAVAFNKGSRLARFWVYRNPSDPSPYGRAYVYLPTPMEW